MDTLKSNNNGTQRNKANSFLRSWAWKREHRPDKDRFDRPYHHKVIVQGVPHDLVIHQAPFKTTGFASTGIVAAYLGASSVLLTDFPDNLDLLQRNIMINKVQKTVSVHPLVWGSRSERLINPFDLIIATDVMYCLEAVDSLLSTLKMASDAETVILLAYGRNRQAEQTFLEKAHRYFSVKQVSDEELDDVYRCVDVDVLELRVKSE